MNTTYAKYISYITFNILIIYVVQMWMVLVNHILSMTFYFIEIEICTYI